MATKIKNIENKRMSAAYKFVQDVADFTNSKMQTAVSKKAKLKDTEKNLLNIFVELLKNKERISTHTEPKIKDIYSYYKKYCAEYNSYVRKFPMMVLNNGIGAAVAFLFSKGKDNNAYELLYEQIAERLKSEGFPVGDSLIKFLVASNSITHRRATIEILSFLKWLKRFADGLIGDEDEPIKEVNNG
jgi:CRISPR-associated protein Cmr5